MKRDMDLCREILKQPERHPDALGPALSKSLAALSRGLALLRPYQSHRKPLPNTFLCV